MEVILGIATAAAVAVGLFIHQRRQQTAGVPIEAAVMSALANTESLSLPELVVAAGLTDGFMNRGKVMVVLNPLVAAGVLTQSEPAGTTAGNRLSVLRFSRVAKS